MVSLMILLTKCLMRHGRANSWKLADAVVADTKARGHYAVVNTQAATSRGWEYMISRMERACLGVYHTAVYLGNAFQEAFPRGRSAVSQALVCALRDAAPATGTRSMLCLSGS